MDNLLIKVVELDQWSSTADGITEMSMEDFEKREAFKNLKGGYAAVIKEMFGGHFEIKEVTTEQGPSIGRVWFAESYSNKLYRYKTNYDSSG